jgi:hypothetical protein
MKKYHVSAIISLFLLAVAFLPQFCMAQKKDSVKTAAVKELVNSRHYTFKAQSMLPLSGRTRQLTSDYDLQVSPDKIVAYLPYFGRAYSAPANPSDGGLQFTAKDFDYTVTDRKKDGWNVSIKPKDVTDTQQMDLTIFGNGNASLQVTGNTRQAISFNGYITAPDKKKGSGQIH